MTRTRTLFKVFFDRINTPHREEAMNKLLERVDDWQSEGIRTVVAWKWRHIEESGNPGHIYVEVEIIYREITQLTQTEINDSLAHS
ncbi:MAG: hypothetical protein WC919_01100 [Candidatus Paceibacterota bacterium]